MNILKFKHGLLAVSFWLISLAGSAQSVTWPLNNTTAPTISGCFTATNATVVGAANPGFQTCGMLGYYANSWNNDLTSSPAYSQYFEFTMTTCPGWIATITTINVNVYAGFSNCLAHQDTYRIRYSTNGFATSTNLTALSFTNGSNNSWDAENHSGLSINLPGNTTLSIRVYFDVNYAGNSAIRNYVGNMTTASTLVLPVELSDFEASLNDNKVKIQWTTETETNNKNFTIERSANGMDFKEIGTLDGAGNSLNQNNYAYYDEAPGQGMTYYRIKQTDYNGDFKYSSRIVQVNNKKDQVTLCNVYPNPASSAISYDLYSPADGTAQVELVDIAGRTVYQEQQLVMQGSQTFNMLLENFAKGVYSLRVSLPDGSSQMGKVVKN